MGPGSQLRKSGTGRHIASGKGDFFSWQMQVSKLQCDAGGRGNGL